MKKILFYILGVTATLLMAASCEKFLDSDSPSAYDSAAVFSNYSLTEGTIFGITEAFCEQNSYRGRFLPWYGFNTDIEWYNTYKPGDGKSDIAAYDCKPNNAQLNLTNGPFPLMYTGVERANLVIEGLREYGNVKENADMAYLLGEALTLRAMIYYDLIKAWGDVPARFSSVDAATIYKSKENRDVIFKQILADLDEAIPYLPYPGATAATSRTDRVNKVFAEGLYARIALAASGYALRPADGAVGTGDPGSIRLSSDPELQKEVLYPKALAYLKDAVGKAALEPDYETYWYNMNNMNNMTAGPAYETLYVIPFGEGRGRWNFTFAISSEGSSWSAGVSRGGDAGPVPTVYFMYDDNDARRDVTCVNYKWSKNTNPEMAGISKWYFGKYRFEWMHAQPYNGGNDDGIKPVVMRYADILLMAAEIENELNGPSDAKQYLLQVRERATGLDAAEAYVAQLSNKEDFFDAIVTERALEFCGEFLRKADLIRWNMLKSKLDEAKADMLQLRSLGGDYSQWTGQVAFRLNEAEDGLDFFFPMVGEEIPAGYELTNDYLTQYDDAKASGFYTDRINGIYYNDPDEYMFWPIFYDTITNSQGAIKNDYHYDNPQ
ncbi:MAG: RagB/SusD family nutrient uptake outer membrane protein [Candidatus Cryptobacteroides sp.]|nr:RagB/SusD family nutrient uptake outer membrane protein [Candidatus Cryptobacteroides sp.]